MDFNVSLSRARWYEFVITVANDSKAIDVKLTDQPIAEKRCQPRNAKVLETKEERNMSLFKDRKVISEPQNKDPFILKIRRSDRAKKKDLTDEKD
jgi:hypothetical protein